MNQRGDTFGNLLVFAGVVILLGLYIGNIEPLIDTALANSPRSGVGTDTYVIVIASSILLLLYGIHSLTRKPETLQFG